jgi:hypothetical protein
LQRFAQPLQRFAWSVAVFARNEDAAIPECVRSIGRAAGDGPGDGNVHLTIVLNGTTDNSVAAACSAMQGAGLPGRVYRIPFADKSNAWNQFVHAVRPPASTYFFVDAYAMVDQQAFALLGARLDDDRCANAAAATPSAGRSAARLRDTLQAQGGLHGSLFALRGEFVERLAALGIRLPVGLCRGDGLIGSLAMHDADALGKAWHPARVAVVPAATWRVRPLSPWRRQDLMRQWRRMIQQGRGRLEFNAIKDIIYREGFQALPAFADQMILDWIAHDPARHRPVLHRDPFAVLALRQIAPPENSLDIDAGTAPDPHILSPPAYSRDASDMTPTGEKTDPSSSFPRGKRESTVRHMDSRRGNDADGSFFRGWLS